MVHESGYYFDFLTSDISWFRNIHATIFQNNGVIENIEMLDLYRFLLKK